MHHSRSTPRSDLSGLAGLLVLLQVLVAVGLPGYYLGLSPFPGHRPCCQGHSCATSDLADPSAPCCCKPHRDSARPEAPEDLSPAQEAAYRMAWEGVTPCRGETTLATCPLPTAPLGFGGDGSRTSSPDEFQRKTRTPWLLPAHLALSGSTGSRWERLGPEGSPRRFPSSPEQVPRV